MKKHFGPYKKIRFNNNEIQTPKMTIIFKTTQGESQYLSFKYGTSINQVLESYLKKEGIAEPLGNKEDKIWFIFNSSRINFGEQTKIEIFSVRSIIR